MGSKIDKSYGILMAPSLDETVQLTRPDEFRANKARHNRWNPSAIIQSWLERFPFAKEFPALEYGATVEVRPVAPECMVGETAQQRTAREARVRASA